MGQALGSDIPRIFRRVNLANYNPRLLREVLQMQDGKIVILSDNSHEDGIYELMRVRIDPEDKEHYYAQKINKNGDFDEMRFFYKNLAGILVEEDKNPKNLKTYL